MFYTKNKFLSTAESPQQVEGSLQSLNLDAVMNQTFIPDYSVKAVTDVLYIAVKRSLYLAAKRATLMEKSKKFGSELESNEPIDYEVEKVMKFYSFHRNKFIILVSFSFVIVIYISFYIHLMKTIDRSVFTQLI